MSIRNVDQNVTGGAVLEVVVGFDVFEFELEF
jgi:hypothetical protein